SFGGMYRKSMDVRIARRVAAACQQKHETITMNRKFFSEFPALAKRAVLLSDGALDVSGAVELYVNRAAKEIAPIRMTGCYGSEVLRGHVAFKPTGVNAEIFAPDLVSLGRQASETYAEEARDRRLTFIAFNQVPWFHSSRLALE